MSKKRKKTLVAVVLFLSIIFLMLTVFRRHYNNVFVEMVIFPWGWHGEDAPVHRFIVQNDGTFITYTGISIHGNVARSSMIMWPFPRNRARIVLNDEEFQNILDMVSEASEGYYTSQMVFFGGGRFALLHDGNIYDSNILEIRILYNELSRLSPIIEQYNDPCIYSDILRRQRGR